MSFSQAQPVTVTLVASTTIYVTTIPAVQKQTAQQVGLARGGDNQTVSVQPSE